MIQNAQVARHDLVLEDGARRDVDPLAVVGDDDHRSLLIPSNSTVNGIRARAVRHWKPFLESRIEEQLGERQKRIKLGKQKDF